MRQFRTPPASGDRDDTSTPRRNRWETGVNPRSDPRRWAIFLGGTVNALEDVSVPPANNEQHRITADLGLSELLNIAQER